MKMKTVLRFIGVSLLTLAMLSLWFAACASGGGGGKSAKTGNLSQDEADIAVFPQLGHTGSYTDTAKEEFSPNGIYFLSGTGNTIKLWDVESGRLIRDFTGIFTTFLFSHDNKSIFTAEKDVTIWDIQSGKVIKTLPGNDSNIIKLALSPDGKFLVGLTQIIGTMPTGPNSGKKQPYHILTVWDIHTDLKIGAFPLETSSSIMFTSDGKYIISDKYIIEIAKGWDEVHYLEDINYEENRTVILTANLIRYDPTSSYVLSFGSGNGYIMSGAYLMMDRKIDLGTGKYIYLNTKITMIDDKHAAMARGNTISIYDTQNGRIIRTISANEEVGVLQSSPNGKLFSIVRNGRFLYGETLYTMKIWDLQSGQKTATIDNIRLRDYKGYSSDGKYIALYRAGAISIFDANSGREIHALTGNAAFVGETRYDPSSGNIIWPSQGGKLKMLNPYDFRGIRTLEFSGAENFYISMFTFSHDGKFAAGGNGGGRNDDGIMLWEMESGRQICSIKDLRNVSSLDFSPDGRYFVTDGDKIIIRDTRTGEQIRTFQDAGYSRFGPTDMKYSPDGNYLVSVSWDWDGIRIWNAQNGRLLRIIRNENPDYFECVAFSPDSKLFVTGAKKKDAEVKVWEIETGREIYTMGHGYAVNDVAFSPDGKYIASASSDKTIKLWDVENGQEIRTFVGHLEGLRSIAFSPDGKQIVSSSYDRTIRLWDVATGQELACFISFSGNDIQLTAASRGLTVETETAAATVEGEWLAITPDGYYQASPRGDRYLNVRVNNTVSGIDSYRSIFYNPDVVQARLQGLPDPASKANVTIQQAVAFTPPIVAIQSPANFTTTDTRTTNLSVAITSQSQPIKNIKIIVNGRLIGKDELKTVKGNSLQPERASLTVTGNQKTVNFTLPLELEPGNNRIEVVAFNGYSENRRYVDVTRNAPAGERPPLPSLWVVAVGVNGYDNAGPRLGGMTSLNFAVADAKGLVDSLKAQEGRRYAKVNAMLIADGEQLAPTAENIRQAFKFLEGADPRRDVVVLFLAGHGISAQESKFFFLPKDAAMNGKNVDAGRAISGDEIMSVLDAPGNRLVFIDACQSGGVDNDRMVRSLMDTNAFVFAASRGNESSYEDPRLGHGYFTYSIMSALGGAPAALAEGISVSVLSMSGFVKDDVPKKTGGRQNPSAYSLGFYDFPMAVIRQ